MWPRCPVGVRMKKSGVVPHLLFYLLGFLCLDGMTGVLYAQSPTRSAIGLQAQLQRDASGTGQSMPDYLFGFYWNQPFSKTFSGTLSASIGTLSGSNFKSRRVPVEYRINAAMTGGGTHTSSNKTETFLYSGLGWMIHKPIEVPSEPDPLTSSQGASIGSSDLWMYQDGITPFLPIGAGVRRQLPSDVRLDLRVGYHLPIEWKWASSGTQLERGYWGLSIGLSLFSRKRVEPIRVSPPDVPVRVLRIVPEQLPRPAVERLPLAELESLLIQFELNSTQLDDKAIERLAWLANVLSDYPDLKLVVKGHTDRTGPDEINEFLSWSRARTVWLWLVDSGISSDRLIYVGYSDRQPLGRSGADIEKDRNRRVSFDAVTDEFQADLTSDLVQPEKSPVAITTISPGYPLFGPSTLAFYRFSTTPRLQTLSYLTAVRDLLIRQPDLNLMILARDGSYGQVVYQNEVSAARARWVRAWLIIHGVRPERLLSFGSGQFDCVNQKFLRRFSQDASQQMLLTPFRGTIPVDLSCTGENSINAEVSD